MKSIRTQMSIYLIIMAVIIFSGLGLIINRRLETLPSYIKLQYQEVTNARAAEISKELEGMLEQVRMTARSSVIMSMDMDEIKPYLLALSEGSKFRNMTISDIEGKAWTTYEMDIDISNQEQFERIVLNGEDEVISKSFQSPYIREAPIVTISHAVKQGGYTVGLVNGVVSTEFLNQIVRDINFKRTGYAWIVDESGNIISHPQIYITNESNIIDVVGDDIVKEQIVSTKEGVNIYTENFGENFLVIHSEIESSPGWIFLMSISYQEAYKEINEINRYLQYSFIAGLILVILYSNSLSKPIRSLKMVFEKASNGDFSVKADESIKNEIGEAGKSFNKMLGQIKDLTYRDPVTGLYNFNSFLLELPYKLRDYKYDSSEDIGYIAVVSVDDFKRVNSIGGYETGNVVLKTLSDSIKGFISQNELVARYFGDEIILLLFDKDIEDVHIRLSRLKNLCSYPFQIAGSEYRLKVSIGVGLLESENDPVEDVIHQGTIAKLKVKKFGGDGYEIYNEDINNAIKEEQEIENSLYHALENGEFHLLYQPIVNIKTNKIVGNEALLRWKNESWSNIPINYIVELMEKKGFIIEVGEWILNEACRQTKYWQDSNMGKLKISVNISPIQLEDPDFMIKVENALKNTGLNPNYLELEITESSAMTNVKDKLEKIKGLKEMGIRISIDDFGTGYSSLSYLTQLPIDTLKIDRSFIKDMLSDSSSKAITSTIITMSKSLNISTTAEGVETEEHFYALKAMGCDKIQGYLVSKPLRPELIESLIKSITGNQ